MGEMSAWLVIVVSLASSFLGSLGSLAIWFHFDLEGYWEQKHHDRMVRQGQKRDRPAPVKGYVRLPTDVDTDFDISEHVGGMPLPEPPPPNTGQPRSW